MTDSPSSRRAAATQLDQRQNRIFKTALIFGLINALFGFMHVSQGHTLEWISVAVGLGLVACGLATRTRTLWSYALMLSAFAVVGLLRLLLVGVLAFAVFVTKVPFDVGTDTIFLLISMVIYFWYCKVCADQIRGINALARQQSGRDGDADDEYGENQSGWDRGN